MDCNEDLYFEIVDSGNFVRIDNFSLAYPDSSRDWINCQITLKAGGFGGKYNAHFQNVDFVNFEKQFKLLNDNLKGTAWFYGLEDQLELKIIGDGIGHFEVEARAMDRAGMGSELTFALEFDQTFIPGYSKCLKAITDAYPKQSS